VLRGGAKEIAVGQGLTTPQLSGIFNWYGQHDVVAQALFQHPNANYELAVSIIDSWDLTKNRSRLSWLLESNGGQDESSSYYLEKSVQSIPGNAIARIIARQKSGEMVQRRVVSTPALYSKLVRCNEMQALLDIVSELGIDEDICRSMCRNLVSDFMDIDLNDSQIFLRKGRHSCTHSAIILYVKMGRISLGMTTTAMLEICCYLCLFFRII